MLSDIDRLLAPFPSDPRGEVVRSLALHILGEPEAAVEIVLKAREKLETEAPFWRAHAALVWNFAAEVRPDSPGFEAHRDELEELRGQVEDPFLWAFLTLRLAWLVPARASPLRQEIVARKDVAEQDRLIARTHEAWHRCATLAQVDAIERDLLAAGPDRFRIQTWGNLWGFLNRTRAAQGDATGALRRHRTLSRRFALLEGYSATRQAYLLAVALWKHPQASREAASTLDPEGLWAKIAAWGLDPWKDAPDGPDRAGLEAWRDGAEFSGVDTQLTAEIRRVPRPSKREEPV
jgi:hypothetical protein